MTTPFGPGHVSLGLYLHATSGYSAHHLLIGQAKRALTRGFDGVTFPEHHGGRAGYPANPVLVAAEILVTSPSGWCGPGPMLPALRPPRALAEDLAWLESGSPGRVGAAFGLGFDEVDFRGLDVPFERRGDRFRRHVRRVSELFDDPAGSRLLGLDISDGPYRMPLLVATKGSQTIAFAAKTGLGLFLPPLPATEAARLVGFYKAQGGSGPITVSTWTWLGTAPIGPVAKLNDAIASTEGDLSWRDSKSVIRVESGTEPAELADRLRALMEGSFGTNLNLRFHLPGIPPAAVDEQIDLFGGEVLPRLRASAATGV